MATTTTAGQDDQKTQDSSQSNVRLQAQDNKIVMENNEMQLFMKW